MLKNWLDVETALKRMGGRQPLLLKILSNFQREFADADHRLRRRLESGDAEGARQLSHKIKGAAGQIGATVLFQISREMELILSDPPDQMAPMLEHFNDALKNTLADIAAYLEKASPPANVDIERNDGAGNAVGDMGFQIERLRACLAIGDMRALEAWTRLKGYFQRAGGMQLADILDQKINQLDFAGATAVLDDVMHTIDLEDRGNDRS